MPLIALDPVKLAWSIHMARKNWNDWQQEFSHVGPLAHNPIFRPCRWLTFGLDYNLIQRPFNTTVILGWRGFIIAQQARISRPDFTVVDAIGLPLSLVSMVSKAAAFLEPAHFIAIDKWAEKGARRLLKVNRLRWRNLGRRPRYEFYRDAVARILNHIAPPTLPARLAAVPLPAGATVATFTLRVLDAYLMAEGGRPNFYPSRRRAAAVVAAAARGVRRAAAGGAAVPPNCANCP